MKKSIFILVFILFLSCDSIEFQKKDIITNKPIATINNKSLFKEDVASLLPKNVDTKDSIVLIRSIINSWAIQQLLLLKAEENTTKNDNSEVDKLVSEYRQALLINGYKERLIKQQLDTLIEQKEIADYYKLNSKNFRLNEELIKTRYLHFSNDLLDKKEVVRLFKDGAIEDLEALELRQLTFKMMMLNDSVWTSLENVMLKMPFSRNNLLKKTKLFQKEDSLGLYLVAIKDVLLRNQIAPLSYIEPTIKQMILHQRKLQLIRDIEKIIVKDAIQNKNFKIH
ncbi:MAG: hypothetical protein HOL35_06935 [Flavobacterium sp.]|nr:hypothetical protein [Flavobacteriaceae bacterium]MBT5289891.1 hypothetical protein [Flavobacterium sp.]MBT6378112.1 hypothetical protein [Flavobacterium sp.]